MKRIFKVLLVILFAGICLGCQKNVKKVSYTTFYEYFSNKKGFNIIDNTSSYDIDIRRYVEAGEGNYQIFYIEYDSEQNADKYIKGLEEDYKVTKYDKYTYAENTNDKYVVLYKVDQTIVIGMSNNKNYKGEINNVLRDLGY